MSRALRSQVIATAHALHRLGWVANHDGNVTAKVASGRFLATPTATSKADVDERNLIEVDSAGKRVAGTARSFSEVALHLAVYRARADVGAVIHAHPPHATAIACSGSQLLARPFMAEAVVSIGATIPTLPFALGSAAADQVERAATDVDAVLLGSHGAMAWGADLEQAYLRLELVEHLAKIATLAVATGGVQPIPQTDVDALLKKRAKAGLGAAADKAGPGKTVFACAPAPHADVQVARAGGGPSDLASVIREELMRALRDN